MDHRSWPWKKRSSDKATTDKPGAASDSVGASLASKGSLGDQENSKKVNFVQISMDSYTHLMGLEDQVNTLEDQVRMLEGQVKNLNEKLSAAHSEMATRDSLVKQHAKVAEEAVSGWEKAGAEALALKHQLESLTVLKITAEDKVSHLDGALKECMRQIKSVKEENEQKLREVILTKTKQWDKIKLELEAKILDLNQGLLKLATENAALSRSLQERSDMLMKINKEKSQAEAEIEFLNENMQSKEKEISSLKYELHIASKELDIRNEENNMSIRSAEVANKQHSESVKKIAKMEAECQRLRGLVRKKLPGPAALAQMKLEVENLGRDSGEPRLRRGPFKNPNPHLSPLPDFSIEKLQQYHKEIEFLTTNLLAMEEEIKMLKEALATRNSELQTSRSIIAKMVGRFNNLETQVQTPNQQSSPKSTVEIRTEGSLSQNESNPPSLISISEDGLDDGGSSAKSWSTTLIADISQLQSDKRIANFKKPANTNHMELMDDFLEMERLACLSNNSNGAISITSGLNDMRTETADHNASVDAAKAWDFPSEKKPDSNPSSNQVSSNLEIFTKELDPDADQHPLSKLLSRVSMILESETKGTDKRKVLEDIRRAMQDIEDSLPHHSVCCSSEKTHPNDASRNRLGCPKDMGETRGSKPGTNREHSINQDLAVAISQIHQFVLSLGREAMQFQDTSIEGHRLAVKVNDFSASVNQFLLDKACYIDFVLDLSRILTIASELNLSVLGYKVHKGTLISSDCIDKVTLLEKEAVQDDLSRQNFPDGCGRVINSTSDPEVLQEGNLTPGFALNVISSECSLKELEQLKLENVKMEMELARYNQDYEIIKSQLQEMEQLQVELKSQLASSQRLNSLADTKLKCMAESYKSLEKRAQELESEVKLLQAKEENLDNELQEEKRSHKDALIRCKDLQEQMQRNKSCSMCSLSSAADFDIKTKQEGEIAAATEKLAECQETIYLLGRQLKALHPQAETIGSQYSKRLQMGESLVEEKPSHSLWNPQGIRRSHEFDQTESDTVSSTDLQRAGEESPLQNFNSAPSSSDIEANPSLKSPNNSNFKHHRPTNSTSSSTMAPEKHPRGFSRFFSSKEKNTH